MSTSKKKDAAALLAAKIAPRAPAGGSSRASASGQVPVRPRCALICVQAPEGYGKTSLLARFRREWLGAGAYVGWLSLDANDSAGRFVEALLLSAYTALGKHALARLAEETLRSGFEPREAIAALLGDLANAARPTALFLDDVHALPEAVSAERCRTWSSTFRPTSTSSSARDGGCRFPPRISSPTDSSRGSTSRT